MATTILKTWCSLSIHSHCLTTLGELHAVCHQVILQNLSHKDRLRTCCGVCICPGKGSSLLVVPLCLMGGQGKQSFQKSLIQVFALNHIGILSMLKGIFLNSGLLKALEAAESCCNPSNRTYMTARAPICSPLRHLALIGRSHSLNMSA